MLIYIQILTNVISYAFITQCFSYHCPEHRCRCGISRPMQTFCVTNRPCLVQRYQARRCNITLGREMAAVYKSEFRRRSGLVSRCDFPRTLGKITKMFQSWYPVTSLKTAYGTAKSQERCCQTNTERHIRKWFRLTAKEFSRK